MERYERGLEGRQLLLVVTDGCAGLGWRGRRVIATRAINAVGDTRAAICRGTHRWDHIAMKTGTSDASGSHRRPVPTDPLAETLDINCD
jgi:hypothetical protein